VNIKLPQPLIEPTPIIHKEELLNKTIHYIPPKIPEKPRSYKLRGGGKKSKISTPRWERWPKE
jgi:hypothetical protein